MLKIDLDSKKLLELDQSTLRTENLLERYDLQEMIINSWDNVRKKIGIPTSFLIGQEIKPHESVLDAIDILAFNPNDNAIIVIELKRDKNKYQLLQSLNYAAMVSSWDSETILENIQSNINDEIDEFRDLITGTDISPDIGIILIAELYDPEVILTADWLSTKYGLNISAYAVEIHTLQGESFLSFRQRYPLKELSDLYESRRRKIKSQTEITWDEMIPKLEYSFAKNAIDLCLKKNQGDPKRRRFTVKRNFQGFKWISVNFRRKYVNVYTCVNKDHGADTVKTIFGENLEINEWKNGISFLIKTEGEFDKLAEWLQF